MFLRIMLLALSSFAVVNAGVCEKGWLQYDDHCYFISQDRVTFKNAFIKCKDMGGWLASTETKAESDWLRLQLQLSESRIVYLGVTDVMEEGLWRWVSTGEIMNLNVWYTQTNEPQGGKGENCVYLASNRNYRWTDVTCTNLYGFVCERKSVQKSC